MRAPRTLTVGVALLLGLSPSVPHAAERCDELVGRLVSVEGDVRVAGRPARMNGGICSDERIEIGRLGRAAVRLEDTQTVVRIDQNSSFVIKRSERGRSWIDLLGGIVYLFSRRPEALRVETPYVNAAIDGTEFVVEVTAGRSEVTVIEGSVRLGNTAGGELRLAPGETGFAGSSGALARRAGVDPRDAVRWALHYPPIGIAERASGEAREAAESLATGDVDAAVRLLDVAPEDGVKLALESMIAVTRNRANDALRLAERAVHLDPASSVARTALSYAHQARFDIDAALASARAAVRNDPGDAHALARLAELQLGVDETAAALASAREATRVDPENSLAHTVLGFAQLIRLDVAGARSAFAEAIARDPGDPLPRLGLGLATIRVGRLAEGREHIEVAASLDPNDALIRSYLGKAYFEERQTADAAAQFGLAQALDPEDPTPWFYDALLAQASNRPVDAYRSIERARALNDNRLIYQSRLLVDKDAAAGSLSLARIYTDLGFEQPAINESTRSISADPTGFSAYRFLADSYAQRERHETARRSVLYQAALLQPLTIDPVQPYAQESDLLILPGTDPVDPSIREYSPLFDREGLQLAGSLVGGGDRTFGDNVVVSGLHRRVAYSLGQFHYRTDGFRPNADIEHDVYLGLLQGQIGPGLLVQAGLQRQETEQGDLVSNFEPDDFNPGLRDRKASTSPHLGLRAELGSRSTLLVAARMIDQSARRVQPATPPLTFFATGEIDGHQASARLVHRGERVTHDAGVELHELDICTIIGIEPVSGGACDVGPVSNESSYASYHYQADFETKRRLHWTLGLGYTSFDDEDISIDRRTVDPRLGLRWRPAPSHELRLAVSRGTRRREVADRTLMPTLLAGFNQLHDDPDGTRHLDVGIAYDRQSGSDTRAGVQLLHRVLDVPVQFSDIDRAVDESQRETVVRGYWNRILRSDLSLGMEPSYELLERDAARGVTDPSFPRRMETLALPIGVRYAHASGFFAHGELSLVHQSVERAGEAAAGTANASSVERDGEYFANLDLSLGTRLRAHRATLRLDIRNLLDETFLFQGNRFPSAEPSSPRFSPGRTILGRVSFSFR